MLRLGCQPAARRALSGGLYEGAGGHGTRVLPQVHSVRLQVHSVGLR